MRQSLFILVLLISGVSFSQSIEATVSAFGIGNYTKGSQETLTKFGSASYSPMFGVLYRGPWKREATGNVKIDGGLGISFTHYKGEWEEMEFYTIVNSNGITDIEELYSYEGNISVLGLEVTPIIATFWDRLEVRSGFFLGARMSHNSQTIITRNTTLNGQNSVTTFSDGYQYPSPKVLTPRLVMHWNTRVAFKFNLNRYSIAPFYQYSKGLSDEGYSLFPGRISSNRHHLGVTFGCHLN
jgi:hypothetical protein